MPVISRPSVSWSVSKVFWRRAFKSTACSPMLSEAILKTVCSASSTTAAASSEDSYACRTMSVPATINWRSMALSRTIFA